MDKKHYIHPMDSTQKGAYEHDRDKLAAHIKKILDDDWSWKHIQHLGAAASLHDHLSDFCYGDAYEVKKVLGRALEYLFMYHETCHKIFCFFAEDAYEHAEAMVEDIQCAEEKEHAMYFLNCIKEYMDWLKAEKAAKTSTTGGPSAFNHM